MKRKLTAKQRKFVREFVKTNNATEAAARTYNIKSRNVARVIGQENLPKPAIKAALTEEFKKEDITVEFVLKGLKGHALQEEEKNVSVKAYELLGKHLELFTEKIKTKDETERMPESPEERKKEIDLLLDRLNKVRENQGNGLLP